MNELLRFSLRPGDVVLTEGGDLDKLGRGFIWNGEVPECVHQNHIFAVRPDLSRLSSEFVAYQTQMLSEFEQMTAEYGFQVIDASRPLQRVAADLRRAVMRAITGRTKHAPSVDMSPAPLSPPQATGARESDNVRGNVAAATVSEGKGGGQV